MTPPPAPLQMSLSLICSFHFSSPELCAGQIKYKDSMGRATAIPDLPEVKRVRETQKHISSVVETKRVKKKTKKTTKHAVCS